MGANHVLIKQFSLSEHASEQRRLHRQKLQSLHHGSSSEESDSEEELCDNSGSEMDSGFLPVSPRQRRVLLKANFFLFIFKLNSNSYSYSYIYI